MNTLCDAEKSALIVIDLQERLMPVIHEGDTVLRHAHNLARIARLLEVPVIGTEQNPGGLGPNVAALQTLCSSVVAKTDFDACAEPAFIEALEDGREELLVIGCEAHVCVLQTVLGLRRRGRRVRVAADAIGSRQPFNKAIAIERMQAAGAEMVTSEMVMFEWLRSSRHPNFRDMLKLIR